MDLGMSELLVIGIVALIIIGPKDLPEMFRQLGRMTAKVRSMAREFNRAMEQAANETGVKDVARDLKAVTNPKSMGLDAVKGAVDKFEKWDPIKNAAKPSTPAAVGAKPLVPPPMPATPKPAEPVAAATPAAPAPASIPPAAMAAPSPAAPSVSAAPANMGPNTAALYEKQAARKKILAESAEKLKALDAPPPAAAAAAPAPKTRRKATPKVEAEAPAEVTGKPARAPRKKKAAER